MYKVTNTIDNTKESFETLELAQEHIQTELNWFNTNEKTIPYTDEDFSIEKRQFIIFDFTCNTGKNYIAENASNVSDPLNAIMFDEREQAEHWIGIEALQGWAIVTEIYI